MPLVGIALLSLTRVCQCGQHNGREQGGALEERLTSCEVSLVANATLYHFEIILSKRDYR